MNSPTELSPAALQQFRTWFEEARVSEIDDPDAACVATVGQDGAPSARMVLIRKVDERGFVFFTNYESRKGQEILGNPKAAICYHWKSLHRQVRVEGYVEQTSEEEADAYYNSRARESRIGAWASKQSRPLPARQELLDRIEAYRTEFESLENPPRPPHWSGFRVIPDRIEFWIQTDFRLHERHVYYLENGEWKETLLYP